MFRKIVVCPDSFKGCLPAREVAFIIAEKLRELHPETEIVELPLADGGEGTLEILGENGYPVVREVETVDPLGRCFRANYNTDLSGKRAFIESARVIGLPLLSPSERNPLIATSRGLGEVIMDAVNLSCAEITVSLGGSATCDGGLGMLDAIEGDLSEVVFKIVCDVKNPLLGENGAVKVFAPQKGASIDDLPLLEKRMEDFVRATIERGLCKVSDAWREGAGAAGGLGFAFQTYLNAETISGIDFIMKLTDFDKQLKDADLIITGEGKLDRQSLMGKVVGGVLKSAGKRGLPVVAFGGIVEDKEQLLEAGLAEAYEISCPDLTLEENMKRDVVCENIRKKITEVFLH